MRELLEAVRRLPGEDWRRAATFALLTTVGCLIFPAVAMIADKRRDGRVHPALWWGTGIYVASFVGSMLLAYSPVGIALTESLVAGTPGAERPMEAYLPPDFAM